MRCLLERVRACNYRTRLAFCEAARESRSRFAQREERKAPRFTVRLALPLPRLEELLAFGARQKKETAPLMLTTLTPDT